MHRLPRTSSPSTSPDLPLNSDDLDENGGSAEATCSAMIRATVERMYLGERRQPVPRGHLRQRRQGGPLLQDFNSGAMIENIVARAKKSAIKQLLDTGIRGIRVQHLLSACLDEFRENEDLPNTTNPDDWARISGKKGERIVFIRTLVRNKTGDEQGRSIESVANTGQYL